MATRFAISTGNWSNTAIWDNGALPTSSDTVYPNGFVVTLDQDVTIDGFNNNISPVYLPSMPIPKMTGNTQPSGTVNAGSDTTNAWKAFDQDAPTPLTFWNGTGVATVSSTAWLSYQFPATKTIKRYYFSRKLENTRPISWTFEGSNNGSTWDILETVLSNTASTPYLSAILPNTTAYLYYRINITAVSLGTVGVMYQFEMTESTATTYGVTTGGFFTVPSSLSGTRNIVQTGAGIVSNNASTVFTTAHTSGNTVNFNITSGGFILNQNYQTGNIDFAVISINGTGTINFNSDLWGTQTLCYNRTGAIYINASATVNVYGNVYSPKGQSAAATYFINLAPSVSNSAVLNIVGNVGASSSLSNVWTIYSQSICTTNITGTLTGDLSSCYYSTVGSILNIPTGTVTVTNLNSNPAIIMTSNASLLTINSPIINKANVNACVAAKMRFYSSGTPYWVFQNNLNADITLAYGSAVGSFPTEADVRFGTTYAASPTRTGTLRVPLPQYVSQGVLTDNTTGTAYLSASDVWNVLTSTITTSGSIGERLKNASTVQTTGDQIASYQV